MNSVQIKIYAYGLDLDGIGERVGGGGYTGVEFIRSANTTMSCVCHYLKTMSHVDF